MIGPLSRRFALVLLLVAAVSNQALAHSPHDLIRALAISPAFATDQTIFLVVSNTLMISNDGGGSWKKLINGLDYKEQLTSLAVSPTFNEDKTVFVASSGNGIYRSYDSGSSWKKVNSGLLSLNINSVKMSPGYSLSNTLIAISEKGLLFISTDKGDTWHQSANIGQKIICSIFLSDSDRESLLVGTVDGRLFESEDLGLSWRPIFKHDDCGAITSLAASKSNNKNRAVFIGTEQCGIFKVDMTDDKFQQTNLGLNKEEITSLDAQTKDSILNLYASSDKGFYSFNQKEGRWEKRSKGLTTDIQAKDPAFNSANFKGICASGDTIFLGGYDGLFKTVDRGKKWWQIDTLSPGIITGLSLFEKNSNGTNDVALATYGGGAYLYSSSDGKWTVINNGLAWTRLNDIAFSPAYDQDGFIFSGSEGNFLVYNRKNNAWLRIPVTRSLRTRIKDKIKRYLKKLGMDSDRVNSIFPYRRSDALFPTFITPSHKIDKKGLVYFGTRGSGLYLSKNHGRSNEVLWEAENGLITALCLSPNYKNDGTLFVGIYDKGVFKSINKGNSWKKVSSGLNSSGEIFLSISQNYENDKTIVMGNRSGLYLSADGGVNWRQINTSRMSGPVKCVSISPRYAEDGTIIAGIRGSGLWISSDKGNTFRLFATQLIEHNYQAKYFKYSTNFQMDSTMYCATSFELFRSKDAGNTWQRLERPLRFEDLREEIRYIGDWNKKEDAKYSALSETFSNIEGNSAKLYFVGTGINWIGTISSEHGNADVFIDGVKVGSVSQKTNTTKEENGKIVFSKTGLKNGSHEIVIKVVCPEGQHSCGWISIDALETEY